ncbi:hypothetical protein Cgig2_017426 [Carnegiea gigantea]|uniref:Uncharacterized protein n=1 Tax=Carnegiea gigantea TaxID=171969 RepID=A0A9Q1Q8H4_9CARY|nr:hypothetical protein Cgig2_017426 [Carnegiea gigantea]
MATTRGGKASNISNRAIKLRISPPLLSPSVVQSPCLRSGEMLCTPRFKTTVDANLETKSSATGVFCVSLVKSIKITATCSILESIFGLKFVDTSPPNLTSKEAKDLCLAQFACPHYIAAYKCQYKAPSYHHVTDLTPEEASALKVPLSDHPSSPNLIEALAWLKEDQDELRNQLDHIQLEMGLMNREIDELIQLTMCIHHGLKLVVQFQPTNLEKAT